MNPENGKRYFGTDGVRGKVGEVPITPDFMLKLGWAAGKVFSGRGSGAVLIGKDTRISGYMFESAIEAGLTAAGSDVLLLGPMPTPAIAYLTRTFHAAAGIVISASHNPYYDNGVKFFDRQGAKLADEVELAIEAQLSEPMVMVESDAIGKVSRIGDAAGRYVEYCKSCFPSRSDLKDFRIVLDCANGATYQVAPNVFRELGADVIETGVSPDGLNINQSSGSTDPADLASRVVDSNADFGIAFDGDGDRVIMIDKRGEVVDGDELLYIIAARRQQEQRMAGGVVGTQMSNLGLEFALRRLGIPFARVPVGDRYVLAELGSRGWHLGGESSGHLVCLDIARTGDGIVAALQVVSAMLESGLDLHELKKGMTKYPQTMINVHRNGTRMPEDDPRVKEAMGKVQKRLGEEGRLLLRPSGTEPVVRVMVEGRDPELVEELAAELASAVKSAIGGG